MSLKSFARRSPAVWFAALVIAGACTAGVDKLTGPNTFELGDASRNIGTTSASGVVISQVYGGGGNAGATLKNDFIELYNGGGASVDLTNWSVQYASSAGTTWSKTNLSGTLAPGHYYLVQEAVGAGGTVNLPTPDATGTIAMSATAAKVALVSSQTLITGACPTADATVVDFIGFGGASGANCFEGTVVAALANGTAAQRKPGNADTQNNAADFAIVTPAPRNSSVGDVVTAVPLEQVAISGGGATVLAGSTVQFTAVGQNAAGAAASNVTITWASSNAAVATVDNSGRVTGVAANATPVVLTATATTGAGATLVTKTNTVSITVTAPIAPARILISQVYGGGGNTGATFKNDFIELFNPTSQPVSLVGWSVQYGSATTGAWTATPLTGTIQPGAYFLIKESAGAAGTDTLPTADLTGVLALGGTAGKVALVRSTVVLADNCPAASVPVQDLVAYGATTCFEGSAPAPATTNATAVLRKGDGSIDTDDNSADFHQDLPTPRNSATDPIPVAGALDHLVIAGGATSVAAGASIQFTTTALDAAGVIVGSAKVTWTSSDATVATVDNAGKVTGKTISATPVTLTASALADGVTKSATTTITVTTATPVASVTLAPNAWTLNAATTKALVATALDADGKQTAGTFTFVSSDPSVATIDAAGLVTGVKAGSTTITATADGHSATATITVTGVSNVTITNGKTSLAYGMQTQFFFGGAASVTWTTTNPAIITVDDKGVMTAKGVGSAQLVATAPDGSAAQAAITTYLAAGATGLRLGHNEELGIPQAPVSQNNFIIRRAQYTVSYNASIGGANWVSWNLDKTHVGANGRCPGTCYSADTALTNAGITAYTTADWVSGNTYDRGHMAPSADWTSSEADNNTTFFLTNFLPQTHDMNAGPWERLENALRDTVGTGREAYIIAGGIFKGGVGLGTISNLGKIRIPNSTYKIIVVTPAGTGLNPDGTLPPNSTVFAVDMPNVTGISGDPFEKYLTTIDKIQQATGYDFLALLREDVQCRVEVRNCAPAGTAIAGAGVAGGVEGQTLSFTGSSADADAGDVLSYAWSVDGQAAGTGLSLSYTFANSGAYVVRLIVSDGKGGLDSAKTTVTVANVAPTVSGITSASLDAGATWSSAGSFTDPGADSWTAVADYDDGSAPEAVALGADKSFSLSHAFRTQGSHTVTVKVTDSDGASGTATATVVIRNTAPTVAPIAAATIDEGGAYSAAGTFSDFGADTWSATVDFGDGTGQQALSLSGTSFSLQHTYAAHGTYTVTVRVMDSGSAVGTSQGSVTVRNVAPVVATLAAATIDQGGTYSATGSFADAGSAFTAVVDYGDGSGEQPLSLTGSAFSLSHPYAAAGSYTVTVKVTDDAAAVGTATAALTVSNVAPVVAAGTLPTVHPRARETVTLTPSFSDAGVSDGPWQYVIRWGDGQGAEFTTSGSASAQGALPAATHAYASAGSYAVRIEVTDRNGGVGSATAQLVIDAIEATNPGNNVSVEPVDPTTGTQPVAISFGTVTGSGTTTVTSSTTPPTNVVALPATFQVANAPLFYDITTTATFQGRPTVCVAYPAELFTGGMQPALLHYDAVRGWEDITTSVNTATHTVCGQTDHFSPFAVVRVNHAPVANVGGPYNASEGAPVAFDASRSSDQDGGTLRYAWTFGDGASATDAQVNHLYVRAGSFTVTLKVTDAGGLVAQSTTTIVVANVAPVISALPSATLLHGETYSAAGSFADPGAESWGATVNYGEGAASSLTLAADKSFALQHRYLTSGVKPVVVSVTDGIATVTQTAQVTVLTNGQAIAELIRQVSALVSASRLRPVESKWILNKLDLAAAQALKGNITPTKNQLQEIVVFIEVARRGSVISATDAASLTAYTQRIIASMS